MSDTVYTRPPVQQSQHSCPVTAMGETFNPFVDPYLSDPYALLAQARQEEPVFYSPETDHWVISRYEDVRDILRDPETYSSRMAQSPIQAWPAAATEMFQAQNFNIKPVFSNNANGVPLILSKRFSMRHRLESSSLFWASQTRMWRRSSYGHRGGPS